MPQHNLHLHSKSERLQLVPPCDQDDEPAAALRTHSISRMHLPFMPAQFSVAEMRLRRETRAEDPHIIDFNIHLRDAVPSLVGMTGIFNIDESNNSCEAGILIDPSHHGKGLATEALYTLLEFVFEVKQIHRVTFETSASNSAMRGWLEKSAMARLEAERKECWRDNEGQYFDARGYSILDWEWRSQIKKNLEERLRI